MATYRLKRKTFAGILGEIDQANQVVGEFGGKRGYKQVSNNFQKSVTNYTTSKQQVADAFKKYKTGGGTSNFGQWAQNEGKSVFDAAKNQRNVVKTQIKNLGNKTGVDIAAKANTQVVRNNAAKSVGIMGGLKNTWAKAGTMGKAGMVAGGLAAAGLAAKGLASFAGGNKNNE